MENPVINKSAALEGYVRAKGRPMYANVCIKDGRKIYTSFGRDLNQMIVEAETLYSGVIAIEEAHAGKPPVWERQS